MVLGSSVWILQISTGVWERCLFHPPCNITIRCSVQLRFAEFKSNSVTRFLLCFLLILLLHLLLWGQTVCAVRAEIYSPLDSLARKEILESIIATESGFLTLLCKVLLSNLAGSTYHFQSLSVSLLLDPLSLAMCRLNCMLSLYAILEGLCNGALLAIIQPASLLAFLPNISSPRAETYSGSLALAAWPPKSLRKSLGHELWFSSPFLSLCVLSPGPH